MTIQVQRKKKKFLWMSFLYRFWNLPFTGKKTKLRIFLNLEWFFNRMAHEYSFKVIQPENHPFRISQAHFLDSRIEPHFHVLDLGCKYGDIAARITPLCKNVTGVDHDKTAINVAKQKYQIPNISFIDQDVFDYLKTIETKVNLILLSHVIEHIDKPDELLQRLNKHCDYMYIEVPDHESSYLKEYRNYFGLSLNYEDDDHVTEFSRKDLMNRIENSGYKIIDCEFRHGMMRFWCSTDEII